MVATVGGSLTKSKGIKNLMCCRHTVPRRLLKWESPQDEGANRPHVPMSDICRTSSNSSVGLGLSRFD